MAVGVGISLPPHVPGSIQGQLHAELLGFQGPVPPFMGALEWWGQDSASSTLLQLGGASSTRSEVAGFGAAAHARVAFPIRSAPKHFMAYLQDMQVLRVHLYQGGSKDKQQGICEIDLRPFLRGSDSDYKLQLDGYFPVLRSSSDRIIIGQLHLLLQTEWGELAELRPKQARDDRDLVKHFRWSKQTPATPAVSSRPDADANRMYQDHSWNALGSARSAPL